MAIIGGENAANEHQLVGQRATHVYLAKFEPHEGPWIEVLTLMPYSMASDIE